MKGVGKYVKSRASKPTFSIYNIYIYNDWRQGDFSVVFLSCVTFLLLFQNTRGTIAIIKIKNDIKTFRSFHRF